MNRPDLIPHLFRTEYSKIVSVLSGLFGLAHIETAEDIASDTFIAALETWPYQGIPENPVGWLYTVAKNKTKNYLKRDALFADKIKTALQSGSPTYTEADIDLSGANIKDSQLQMLFAICHPSVSPEAQVGLALRILCGFGIDEIAAAFLTNKETINKRLYRAKEKLRTDNIPLAFPPENEMEQRLDRVLTTVYLLFNEGYYSETQNSIIREELCTEAMQLTRLLLENEKTKRPTVHALYALMCFHGSRFAARKSDTGDIILYNDQDENLWDPLLISEGARHMYLSASGTGISKYHLEAGIAYWHTVKTDAMEKWETILQLYNRLLQISYTSVAALNRIYALSKVSGFEIAISEAEKLQLTDNHYYHSLLGELYSTSDHVQAIKHFEKALNMAKTKNEKQIIHHKLKQLGVLPGQ